MVFPIELSKTLSSTSKSGVLKSSLLYTILWWYLQFQGIVFTDTLILIFVKGSNAFLLEFIFSIYKLGIWIDTVYSIKNKVIWQWIRGSLNREAQIWVLVKVNMCICFASNRSWLLYESYFLLATRGHHESLIIARLPT